MVTPLKESSAFIIEIKIGAAPIGEIWIDGTKEMLTTVMIKRTNLTEGGFKQMLRNCLLLRSRVDPNMLAELHGNTDKSYVLCKIKQGLP